MVDDKTLSDEQATQLNSHEPVVIARKKFLQLATAYLKAPNPELLEEKNLAEAMYSAVFTERLYEVQKYEWPQPAPVAVPTKRTGFK